MPILGREEEKDRIRAIVEDEKLSFIAIYGRRRVGKTFLIKEFFDNQFTFYATHHYKRL
jgi:uncharacterized protein